MVIRNIQRHHQLSIQMVQHQELMEVEQTMNKTLLPGKNTIKSIMNIMANILKVIYHSSIPNAIWLYGHLPDLLFNI